MVRARWASWALGFGVASGLLLDAAKPAAAQAAAVVQDAIVQDAIVQDAIVKGVAQGAVPQAAGAAPAVTPPPAAPPPPEPALAQPALAQPALAQPSPAQPALAQPSPAQPGAAVPAPPAPPPGEPPPGEPPPPSSPEATDAPASALDAPAERRSGFTFGLSGGLLIGGARGYPNDVAKIGLAEYRTSSGVGVSNGGALWLGGALSDWLNVGIGMFGGGFERAGLRVSSAAFQARLELFPLFYRGGHLRDLGVLLTTGTGVSVIERGDETLAEGVGTSAVGGGVFYEPWRWWQLTFGPQLEYLYQFSDSMRAHVVALGIRTAFYGGP